MTGLAFLLRVIDPPSRSLTRDMRAEELLAASMSSLYCLPDNQGSARANVPTCMGGVSILKP